jgi:hypothetical protein
MKERDTDRAVGFIDIADCDHTQSCLGNPRPIDQAGLTTITRAGVDFGELDQI